MIYNGRVFRIGNRCDYFCCCYRALEASLLTSGLNETEMEEIRQQNQEQLGAGAPTEDLSLIMELSKREEEARLNRLREEEEELEKVFNSFFNQSLNLIYFYLFRFYNYLFKKNKFSFLCVHYSTDNAFSFSFS